MADIEQSLQEIQQERSRLLTAKENLKTAITGKGVTVPDSAKLDEYSSFVNEIQQGESVDLSFVTAEADKILSGYVGSDKDGNPVNGSIQTVTPSLSGNKFTVGKGFVPENKELTVPVVTATLTANVVTIPAGYHDQNTVTVPEAESPTVSGNTVTIHQGYNPEEKTVETEGGGSGGGAFDIVKVTEYSPYVPAYPEQIGYIFDLDMQWYNWETSVEEPYDASAYEGLYTVTEDTKSCTGLGRVFRNANGKWLYAFSYDNWGQATDDSNSANWCISDDLGYSPDSGAFMSSDSVSKGTLPTYISNWNSMMYTVKACTITTQVTAPATEAIPMVLKGSKAESYNTETRTFVDGSSQVSYSGFEIEPLKEWYYASTSGKLIGNAVTSNVTPSLYIPLHQNKATAETGQTLTTEGNFINEVVAGVPCTRFDGNLTDITPVDFLVTGKSAFATSMMLRKNTNDFDSYYGNFTIFHAYSTRDNYGGGFRLWLEGGSTFCIQGGNIKENTASGWEPRINNYRFPKDTWIHFCYVNNVTNESLYINGVEIWSERRSGATIREFPANGLTYATLGCTLTHNGYDTWEGLISEFKYFKGSISPAQVKAEADRCLAMVTE